MPRFFASGKSHCIAIFNDGILLRNGLIKRCNALIAFHLNHLPRKPEQSPNSGLRRSSQGSSPARNAIVRDLHVVNTGIVAPACEAPASRAVPGKTSNGMAFGPDFQTDRGNCMDFFSVEFFSALAAIIVIDLVLAGDNADRKSTRLNSSHT